MSDNCKNTGPAIAFKALLRELNSYLRPHGFKRDGQRFGRESAECWQVLGVQRSRYSNDGEMNVTVNFGVTSKRVLEFEGEYPAKMPHDSACPIRWRIGEFLENHDVWWTIKDDHSAREAYLAMEKGLEAKGFTFLDNLQSDQAILNFYGSGINYGFPIWRDETRLILLAHLGSREETLARLGEYWDAYVKAATSKRVCEFLQKFQKKYPTFAGEKHDFVL